MESRSDAALREYGRFASGAVVLMRLKALASVERTKSLSTARISTDLS